MSDDDVTAEPDVDEVEDAVEPPPEAYGVPVLDVGDQQVLFPSREQWLTTAQALLADGWTMCVDITAVDYLTYGGTRVVPDGVALERYEVVASFLSYERAARLRARVQVPADDPTIDSLYDLYPGTDFSEREVFDLMGITFAGHPDQSRILMPESWDGHPLRKDYAIGAIPVQFKAPNEHGSQVGGQ